LHEDNELTKIYGSNIISREPIRSWPLSVVERVVFNDGASQIYKVFRNFPIEIKFYEKIQSHHIPKVFYSQSNGERNYLLLEDVKGEYPEDLNQDELLNRAHQVRKIIYELGSVESFRYDLSTKGYDDFVFFYY
jgi:hypothetical protein